MTKMTVLELLVCCAFLIFSLSTEMCCLEDSGSIKIKRSPSAGLFSFPRTGRSGGGNNELSDNDWDDSMVALTSNEEYNDYAHHTDPKRVAMVSYPRVGRSGGGNGRPIERFWIQAPYQDQKRANGQMGANGGMWFGPRLGRVQKREVEHVREQQ